MFIPFYHINSLRSTWSSKILERTFSVGTANVVFFKTCNWYSYLKEWRACLLKDEGDGWNHKVACFANYIGINDWQHRYIRSRYYYVCRIKQGRKTRVLWGNTRYHRMCNVIAEIVITEFELHIRTAQIQLPVTSIYEHIRKVVIAGIKTEQRSCLNYGS